MAQTDLYQILGVARDAGADEIKRSYRELARQLHPDRNPDDPKAEERFKEVSAAYAVLSDEKRRALYDEFGPDGLREGFDAEAARNYARWARHSPGAGRTGGREGAAFNFGGGGLGGFGDLEELLGSLFGASGARRGQGQRVSPRGGNLETEVTISLREATSGTELRLADNSGQIRVPAGVTDGQRVRVAGQGREGPGGRGDLFVRVHVAVPTGFTREGDDLTIDLPLRVSQAVTGDSVEVPTPEGTTVTLRVPAGTQSGRRLRLRGKGMTRKGGGRGDLFARALIRVPTGDDEALRDAAAALDAFYYEPG